MAATAKGTKAPVAKRAPAPRPKRAVPVEEDPGGIPVLRLTTVGVEETRVPLFYIDDREYSVSSKPGLNVALKFLSIARAQGEGMAIDYALGKLLGPEGYSALLDYDELTPDQLKQIMDVVQKLVMGALEIPKA